MPLFQSLLVHSLPLIPKPIVHLVARRYVAGATREEAAAKCVELHRRGIDTTVALLGEEVEDRQLADAAVREYQQLLETLSGPDRVAAISVKLTLLGLRIDEELCRENLMAVGEVAKQHDCFVRIDMEDHTCTDATLRLYGEAQERFGNFGLVLQAYLKRTLDDIAALDAGTNVRLCKGIYIEPEELAYQDYEEVRSAFVRCLDALFDRRCFVAVATHDDVLLDKTREAVRERVLDGDSYELQMLLGVRDSLRETLHEQGHPMRVYVPYGPEWYEYSVRRLRENPKLAMYVLRAMLFQR